ncbi:class F sortase [Streptomyces sp. NPDC048002]|uniref:class F sortase n=1 Tax=Streptomyces sp. NPDC048002 TaxID=3154344 RepID=UPI0033CF1801
MAVPPSSPTTDPGTGPDSAGRGSRTVMLLGAVVAVVLAVSLFGGNDTSSDTASPGTPLAPSTASSAPRTPPAGQPAEQPAVTPSVKPEGKHLPRSKPVRLLIPKISVDAPFTDLAIGPTGQLDPPPAEDTNLVGWHAKGASPGETGTSIVAGHVDTTTAPAVFAGLSELKKGDKFQVERADGRTANFVVDSAETFSKDDFPSDRVYADTPRAQVRLITCAGDYDRTAKDYTDNLVVFAHLV